MLSRRFSVYNIPATIRYFFDFRYFYSSFDSFTKYCGIASFCRKQRRNVFENAKYIFVCMYDFADVQLFWILTLRYRSFSVMLRKWPKRNTERFCQLDDPWFEKCCKNLKKSHKIVNNSDMNFCPKIHVLALLRSIHQSANYIFEHLRSPFII